MTQEEKDAILGRTKREHREAKAEFGAIRERHTRLVSEFRELLLSMEQEPLRVYASRGLQGTLQAAMEMQGARYVYGTTLADKLTLDAVGKHLDEYRATFERVEDRRRSLIAQGDGDPGPTE